MFFARNRNPGRGTATCPARGMTLVEVLVALLLLSFGLFGVVDLYSSQARYVSVSRRQTQAQELAFGYLAQLQTAGYAALDESIRKKDPAGSGGEVSLHAFPIAAQESNAPKKPVWNARLKRETIAGLACIRIAVEVYLDSPTASPPATNQVPGSKKEVVGYVVSSATP